MWLGERFRFNLTDDLNHLTLGYLHPNEAMYDTLSMHLSKRLGEGGAKGREAAAGGERRVGGGERRGEERRVEW